jgi:hypothetical protein
LPQPQCGYPSFEAEHPPLPPPLPPLGFETGAKADDDGFFVVPPLGAKRGAALLGFGAAALGFEAAAALGFGFEAAAALGFEAAAALGFDPTGGSAVVDPTGGSAVVDPTGGSAAVDPTGLPGSTIQIPTPIMARTSMPSAMYKYRARILSYSNTFFLRNPYGPGRA